MHTDFFAELLNAGMISVRVVPNAKKTEIVGKMLTGEWKLRVQAPAREGKANIALQKFLQREGEVLVEIAQGTTSRNKVLKISAPPSA